MATFWVPIGKNGILFSSKSCYTDCSRQSDQHFEGTNTVKRFAIFDLMPFNSYRYPDVIGVKICFVIVLSRILNWINCFAKNPDVTGIKLGIGVGFR